MNDPVSTEGWGKALTVAKGYADLILKPPLTEIGQVLGDYVNCWRTKNKVRLLLKVKDFCEAKGIDPKKIDPDVFVPLLEEAGNTSNEELSDMFARLLATHVDDARSSQAHTSFAKVLGQLSSEDVKILNIIDESERASFEPDPTHLGVRGNYLIEKTIIIEKSFGLHSLDVTTVALSLQNLERLVIIVNDFSTFTLNAGEPSRVRYTITAYGDKFLRACNDPGKYWRNIIGNIDEIKNIQQTFERNSELRFRKRMKDVVESNFRVAAGL